MCAKGLLGKGIDRKTYARVPTGSRLGEPNV